jgi:hypothetical protein
MTPCIPENFSTWLVDWSLVTGNTMPPRDPNDDDDEDDDAEPDDEPAVIRDPDEWRERPNGQQARGQSAVCTENLIRVDEVRESPKLAEWWHSNYSK